MRRDTLYVALSVAWCAVLVGTILYMAMTH